MTELRAVVPWIAEGSAIVQQQALRDFDRAKHDFFRGTRRYPRWRVKGESEGFRIVNVKPKSYHRLNRKWGEIAIPKAGWVRFRWSRSPNLAKSFRVTFKSGQWHIAFAYIPDPVKGLGNGSILGIDRGVIIPFACSDGTTYNLPKWDGANIRRLQRHLARQKKGSIGRQKTKTHLAKIQARNARRCKDAIEKATTDLARRCDFFRIEDLQIRNMTRSAKGTLAVSGNGVRQKAGLNRAILASGWGLFARRLEDKAPYRVERVKAAFTSQRCAACGYTASENRESQAVFRCQACGYAANADFNAAQIIAGGHPVTARGGMTL